MTRTPGVGIDSGGLAKGLFADLIGERLESHAAYAIDCGGDLRLGGADGASGRWRSRARSAPTCSTRSS